MTSPQRLRLSLVVVAITFALSLVFAAVAHAEVRTWSLYEPSITGVGLLQPAPGQPPTAAMPEIILGNSTRLNLLNLGLLGTPLTDLSPRTIKSPIATSGSLIAFGDGDALRVTDLTGRTQTVFTFNNAKSSLSGIQALAFEPNGDLLVGNNGPSSDSSPDNTVSRFDSLAPGTKPTIIAGGGDSPVTDRFQYARSVKLARIVGVVSYKHSVFIATTHDLLVLTPGVFPGSGYIAITEALPRWTRFEAIAVTPNDHLISVEDYFPPGAHNLTVKVLRDKTLISSIQLPPDQPRQYSVAVASDETIFLGIGDRLRVISDQSALPRLAIQARRARLDLLAAFRGTRSAFPQINVPLVNAEWKKVRELLSAIIPHAAAFTRELEEQYVPTKLLLFREELTRLGIRP